MIEFAVIETQWGPFGFVAADDRLLATVTPSTERKVRKRIAEAWPEATERANLLPRFRKAVVAFYSGTPIEFDVDVDLSRFSEFQQAVLHACRRIPYGKTASYADLARAAGRPGAARAAGSTMARNPMPIVIPCHRVVRADGHIGEYGAGGPEAKRAVLHAEGIDTAGLERLAGRGVRFTGSDTTGIYCFPSCRHARRTMPRHEVGFHSAEEALAAGFRPCRVCRPLESAPFAA